MKKVFTVAIATLVAATSFAQKSKKSDDAMSFGFQAGWLLGNGKGQNNNVDIPGNKAKSGYKVGVNANFSLSSSVSFNPELNYVSKGIKYESTFGGSSVTESNTINFLEIPLNVTYHFNNANKGLFAGAGPVVSLGLSGKSVQSFGGVESTQTIKFDGKKDADLPSTDMDAHLKSLEIGANAYVGYALENGLNFRLNYNLGFSNLNPNPNSSIKTNYLGLTVGFSFLK